MAEEKQTKQGKEEEKAISEEKKEAKIETKTEQKPVEEKIEAKKEETKAEKKKADEKKPSKSEALAYGRNAPISTKHAIAICRAIKNKRINDSLKILEDVLKKKWAIAFKGEIPHRKGMASGRYPINATARIYFANANRASRPHKRGGSMKFKRTHVLLKIKDFKNNKK
ncbi:hypothetical protein HYT26_04160 [Candidatus Pacearchaeota archaeon]|nr:hypothetical protein [Candidatus Pacearchaeota archaeon]